MSLSIIIRKKDTFHVPVRLSVQQLNRYAWRKHVHRRKRSTWQKFKSFWKAFWGFKKPNSMDRPIALF